MKRTGYSLAAPVSVVSLLSLFAPLLFGQGAGPYTPDQVYSVLHDALRKPLAIDGANGKGYWLSLTIVGSVVDADDQTQINDLANFCPPASPVLSTFSREPKLDAIYERVLNGMTGPVREHKPEYFEAKAILEKDGQPSDKYRKYREYEDTHSKEMTRFSYGKSSAERQSAQKAMERAEADWVTFGYRSDINNALKILFDDEYNSGATRALRRRNVLEAFRKALVSGTDIDGTFESPMSKLSPPPDKWNEKDGWVSVSYSSDSLHNYRFTDSSSSRSFSGLNLGFVSVGSGRGGGNSTEYKVNRVHKFSYQFELKRIHITRPWLDTDVFFEPRSWTWKRIENTKTYPRVAVSAADGVLPMESSAREYDSKLVSFALLPQDLIIARGLRVEATVNKQDYEYIERSGSSKSGGLFGIFGGRSRSWTTTKTSEDANTTTFKVESPGVSVIGVISQILPVCPDPNTADKWGGEAWLPPQP